MRQTNYTTHINTYIELVGKSNIDANKTIKSIEVVVAYELFAGAPDAN